MWVPFTLGFLLGWFFGILLTAILTSGKVTDLYNEIGRLKRRLHEYQKGDKKLY